MLHCFSGIQSTGSALHSLQEVDDMDFGLEEEMIPDIEEPGSKNAEDEIEVITCKLWPQ